MAPSSVIPLDLTSLLILASPSIIVLIFLYIAVQYLTVKDIVSLHELPGPPGGWYSPVGHLPQLLDPDVSPLTHARWAAQYGPTFQTFGFGPFDRRLFTLDPAVAKYVLDHPEKYQKGWQGRAYIDQAIGEGGLVMAEGGIHRVMRRILQPVFSKKNLDALAPVSASKARELCSLLHSLSSRSSQSGGQGEQQLVDIAPLLTRATFDVIGLAGFGYSFNALSPQPGKGEDPLYLAFQRLFGTISGFTLRMYLGIYFPWLDERFPDRRVKAIRQSRELIDGTVKGWIRQRLAEIDGEKAGAKEEHGPKDLLTLMIREIVAAAPRTPMVDDLVIAQVNTFLMAGSETTALTIAWALYYLSQHASVQTALREECLSVPSDQDNVFVEGIDRLPLLEKVVRETLRLTPAVHSTFRQAVQDDIIPLSPSPSPFSLTPATPTSPSLETSGRRRGPTGVSIRKGQYVHIPFEGLNMLPSVWGEDAGDFRPSRWDSIVYDPRLPPFAMGEKAANGNGREGRVRQGGVGWKSFAGLASFGTGPKACVGMRFALIEIKSFLFYLVRDFEFECPKPIVKRNAMVVRPIVDGENERGQQLPLLIRPVARG